MPTPRELILGWMGKPLKVQLKGLGLKRDLIEHFQKDNDGISRLGIRSIITPAQREAAYNRLAKEIQKAITVAAKPKGDPR